MPKRNLLPIVVILAGLIAAGTATAHSEGHRKSPVPAKVQRAIAHSYSQFAYLPTRVPTGLRYTSYNGVHGFEFTIWFNGAGVASLQYGVTVANCSAQGSPAHTFKVNGITVSWSGTYTDQQAWRCATRTGTSLVIQASRSVAGDANPITGNALTKKQHRDALALARVVAYAEPIR